MNSPPSSSTCSSSASNQRRRPTAPNRTPRRPRVLPEEHRARRAVLDDQDLRSASHDVPRDRLWSTQNRERVMSKRNLTVQLDDDVIHRAKVIAAKRGTSVSGWSNSSNDSPTQTNATRTPSAEPSVHSPAAHRAEGDTGTATTCTNVDRAVTGSRVRRHQRPRLRPRRLRSRPPAGGPVAHLRAVAHPFRRAVNRGAPGVLWVRPHGTGASFDDADREPGPAPLQRRLVPTGVAGHVSRTMRRVRIVRLTGSERSPARRSKSNSIDSRASSAMS